MKKILIIMVLLFLARVMWSFSVIGQEPIDTFIVDTTDSLKAKHHIKDGNIIFVDFSKPSCEERLFIATIKSCNVIYSGVVLHGMGGKSTPSTPEFSNEIGSNCSSLGFYKVGELSRAFGIYPCYRLDGLDSTNSNARKRGILIHPSIMASLLPYPKKGKNFPLTKSSEGCFSVSLHTFLKIKSLKGPVYIYAFNGKNVKYWD